MYAPPASAKERAQLAESEAKNEFPVIHAQAVVQLWGAVEALVGDLLGAWLANRPDARRAEAVGKLWIRFAEFEVLSPEERHDYLVSELKRELGTAFKAGVNAFEDLLQPFGLSGLVPTGTKKALFELSQVRNVIVHRRGVADNRLIAACPWLGLETGNHLRVGFESFDRYFRAAMDYEHVLVARLIERLKEPTSV